MVLNKFRSPTPHVVEDNPVPRIVRAGGLSVPEYREQAYHIVLSVDVGNTTSDCVITGTNLGTGLTYIIDKTVMMFREIRDPKPGESTYGENIDGITISSGAVQDFVAALIRKSVQASGIDLQKDLDLAVYSTGLVKNWEEGSQVNEYLGALAKGCVDAGIPMSKMRPVMSKNSLPTDDREYSMLDKVAYTGYLAGTIPATGLAGDAIVANDMEGDLALAGIKQGALMTPVDLRNPCLGLDFGTILDGRITEAVPRDRDNPYARTNGVIIGLGGAVADAMVRGTGEVDPRTGSARDFFGDAMVSSTFSKHESAKVQDYVDQVMDMMQIEVVLPKSDHFGLVPISPQIAENSGITIIGCDCGEHFSKKGELTKLGAEAYRTLAMKGFTELVDRVNAEMALRIVDVAAQQRLLPEDSAIGFSGRGIMSGRKPEYVVSGMHTRDIYPDPQDRVVFVSSALPRGASLVARCMGSLGNPKRPLGGCRGEACILGRRRKVEGAPR